MESSQTGETDLMMISHLLKLFPRIHNIVVEPTADFVEKYRSLFKAKQHLIEGVETEWREQTLESFQNSVDSSVSYHFISAIHSLYHFEDYKATLRYMYDLLEEGGVLLIVMGAEDSGLTRLRKKVRQLESDYLIFHDAEHGAFHDHNAQHVCKAFDDMGIKYRCSRQRRRIQVTECLSADTEASNLMLDFLLQVSYFRKTAPPDSQKEILDYIESVDCCDPRGEDGELILNSDCDAVIVHKSAD
ncbi:histamine N-methyltransferase-like isoform X2 [Ptychodera flava]|uniref:histamine N-methyltransferase-like isoform X2 n=1 Tax=Ptychodera flava TaxID=63121 RepID=UPI003969F5EF